MDTQLDTNFLYSSVFEKERGMEQFIPEHSLGIIISGDSYFYTNSGTIILKEGTIALIRRNQLAKTFKIPGANGQPFKVINVVLDQNSLRKYAAANNISRQPLYRDHFMIDFTGNTLLKGYFDSLLPYFDVPGMLTPTLSALKTTEAIELLLQVNPTASKLLFDFNEPHKIDLEAYMNQNYSYNVPLAKFAALTGRSLATFKRDFQKVFACTPERWLQKKRLEHAYFLISQKHQNPVDAYHEAGFENLSHFSTAFKKQYGITPSGLKRNEAGKS